MFFHTDLSSDPIRDWDYAACGEVYNQLPALFPEQLVPFYYNHRSYPGRRYEVHRMRQITQHLLPFMVNGVCVNIVESLISEARAANNCHTASNSYSPIIADHPVIYVQLNILTGSSNARTEVLAHVDAEFSTRINTALSAALTSSPNHMVRVLVYPEKHTIAVYTSSVTPLLMHKLCGILLGVFPAIKDDETIAISWPLDLYIALGKLNAEDYDTHYKAWLATAVRYLSTTRRPKIMEQALRNYGTQALRNAQANVSSLRNNINEREAALRQTYAAHRDAEHALFMATQDVEKDMVEIVAYYAKKEQLVNIITTPNGYDLTIRTPVLYFETKSLEVLLSSNRAPDYMSNQTLRRLLYDIFIAQRFKLVFTTDIMWHMRNFSINRSDRSGSSDRYYQNPHIREYNCFGNNSMHISKALRNNDYIIALEQTIASCAGINFEDAPVMQQFCNDLRRMYDGRSSRLCIEHKGELISLADVRKMYEQEDAKDNKPITSAESAPVRATVNPTVLDPFVDDDDEDEDE